MSFQFKIIPAVIGVLFSTLLLGSCAPSNSKSNQNLNQKTVAAQRLSRVASSWMAYVPAYELKSLMSSKAGVQLWSKVNESSANAIEYSFLTAFDPTELTGVLESISSSDSSGGGVSTSPSLGSGDSLPTSPSLGAGATLPTSPELGSGESLPVAPALGTSATVNLNPSTAGDILAALGGVATAAEFAEAFCSYVDGLLTYVVACSGADISMSSLGLGSRTQCASQISMIIPDLATYQLPAPVVIALNCIGDRLRTASCVDTGADLDMNAPLMSAFGSCGLGFTL